RFEWEADDPEIVADVLFAVANVISFARTTYLMPAFEALGPLQISFTRMLFDIVRFMVLYVLVLFAFMVGLHNLYWYYGRPIPAYNEKHQVVNTTSTQMFGGLQQTLYSLFWSMFSQISVKDMPLKLPLNVTNRNMSEYYIDSDRKPTNVVDNVGMILLAVYHGIIIIVLVNMLIAMMSHSFETIQVSLCQLALLGLALSSKQISDYSK
ncbi:Short transient receptor putative channel 7, partial [Cichlidogyrus casuarinus]